MLRSIALIAVFVAVLASRPSDACTPGCVEGQIGSGVAPANATAIPISRGLPQLTRADDGGTVASSVGWIGGEPWLVPAAPLEANTDYFVDFDMRCALDGGRSLLRTGQVAPVPASLGDVTVSAPRIETVSTAVGCGSCVANILASNVTVSVALSPDVSPWEGSSRFMLFVDGALFSRGAAFQDGTRSFGIGPTDAGRLEYTVYARCQRIPANSADNGLELGAHTGEVHAYVGGSSTPLVSAPFTFALSCDNVCLEQPDGCGSFGPIRYSPCDAGVPDAGVQDAGTIVDAGTGTPDAGSMQTDAGTSPSPPGPSGCGCDSAMGATAVLCVMLLRRRRSRR